MKVVNALTLTNHNGGFYNCGRHYGLAKKREVAFAFLQLQEEHAMLVPPIVWVTKRAKVGWHDADLVIKELRDSSKSLANLIEPAIIHNIKTTNDGKYRCFLLPKEEMFLLSLHGQKTGEGPAYCTFTSYSLPMEGLFLAHLYHFGTVRGLGTVAGLRKLIWFLLISSRTNLENGTSPQQDEVPFP
jgi:hypothetical protein